MIYFTTMQSFRDCPFKKCNIRNIHRLLQKSLPIVEAANFRGKKIEADSKKMKMNVLEKTLYFSTLAAFFFLLCRYRKSPLPWLSPNLLRPKSNVAKVDHEYLKVGTKSQLGSWGNQPRTTLSLKPSGLILCIVM